MDEYLRFENATFLFKQLQFFEIFRSQPVFIAGAYSRGGGGAYTCLGSSILVTLNTIVSRKMLSQTFSVDL